MLAPIRPRPIIPTCIDITPREVCSRRAQSYRRAPPGANSAAGAFCNSPQRTSIEAYIQFTPELITEEGEVTDDSTTDFLRNFITEFYGFITLVYTVIPRS